MLKGKVTGDRGEEMKGRARQKMGDAGAKVSDLRDDIRYEAERRRRELDADEALKREDGSR